MGVSGGVFSVRLVILHCRGDVFLILLPTAWWAGSFPVGLVATGTVWSPVWVSGAILIFAELFPQLLVTSSHACAVSALRRTWRPLWRALGLFSLVAPSPLLLWPAALTSEPGSRRLPGITPCTAAREVWQRQQAHLKAYLTAPVSQGSLLFVAWWPEPSKPFSCVLWGLFNCFWVEDKSGLC